MTCGRAECSFIFEESRYIISEDEFQARNAASKNFPVESIENQTSRKSLYILSTPIE